VHTTRPDTVAAEEPLEIRLAGTPLAVTMRTPGDDFDLVHGFLATEGIIAGPDDVAGLRYCDSVDADGRNTYNVVDVDLAAGVPVPDTGLERNFYTSSSCGVCGKASIDAIRTKTRFDITADDLRVLLEVLLGLPDALGARSRCSTRPAVCTARACSPRRAHWSRCARTWAGTTPSTRSSATPSGRGACRCRGTCSW
jgi:FdhD protein